MEGGSVEWKWTWRRTPRILDSSVVLSGIKTGERSDWCEEKRNLSRVYGFSSGKKTKNNNPPKKKTQQNPPPYSSGFPSSLTSSFSFLVHNKNIEKSNSCFETPVSSPSSTLVLFPVTPLLRFPFSSYPSRGLSFFFSSQWPCSSGFPSPLAPTLSPSSFPTGPLKKIYDSKRPSPLPVLHNGSSVHSSKVYIFSSLPSDMAVNSTLFSPQSMNSMSSASTALNSAAKDTACSLRCTCTKEWILSSHMTWLWQGKLRCFTSCDYYH